MSALCLAAAALAVAVPAESFTLAWMHSIEKVRWEEDYRIRGARLELVGARIKGSAAGMEPPEGAVLRNGIWHYRPALPALPSIRITRSPYTADYTLCVDGACRALSALLGPADDVSTVELAPCPER